MKNTFVHTLNSATTRSRVGHLGSEPGPSHLMAEGQRQNLYLAGENHTLPSYASCLQSTTSAEATELLQINRNEAKKPVFPAGLM